MGDTALVAAASAGHRDVVELLEFATGSVIDPAAVAARSGLAVAVVDMREVHLSH